MKIQKKKKTPKSFKFNMFITTKRTAGFLDRKGVNQKKRPKSWQKNWRIENFQASRKKTKQG